MTPEQEIDRGRRAKQLMDDELIKEAFQSLADHLHSAWENSCSPEAREQAWQNVRALNEVRASLEAIMATGQMAALSIDKH